MADEAAYVALAEEETILLVTDDLILTAEPRIATRLAEITENAGCRECTVRATSESGASRTLLQPPWGTSDAARGDSGGRDHA